MTSSACNVIQWLQVERGDPPTAGVKEGEVEDEDDDDQPNFLYEEEEALPSSPTHKQV